MLARGKHWLVRIRGLHADASRRRHAELDEATTLDDGDPVELGRQYRDLLGVLPHLNVLGGCCGTDHRRVGESGGPASGTSALKDFLLKPLRASGLALQPVQHQFSAYTALRFPAELDLRQPEIRAAAGHLLSGLAQVEERLHAGELEDQPSVPNAILNSRHWTAVSYLGAAHVVADQPPPNSAIEAPPAGVTTPPSPDKTQEAPKFNELRLRIVRDKYFVSYLTALLQRLTLHRTLAEAGVAIRSPDRNSADLDQGVETLRRDLLDFAVSGHFTEVSSRDVHNRYYELAQRGLHVDAARDRVHEAVAELDAARQARYRDDVARKSQEHVARVADVQGKLEWLEVFFVSFYAAELTHILGALFAFRHDYASWSVLGLALFAGGLSLFGLRPWHLEHQEPDRRKQRRRIVTVFSIIFAVLIAWFIIGFEYFRTDGSSAPHAVPPGPAATDVPQGNGAETPSSEPTH